MLARFLDTEISFIHYLTRRSTLEDVMDFDGDEQDLLSMYLANRFLLDAAGIEGQKILFQDADDAVRKSATARTDRTEVAIHGLPPSPFWMAIIAEVYAQKGERHRFDIITNLLNQGPVALAGLERKARRWRRGDLGKNNEIIHANNEVGGRLHSVAFYLGKPIDGEEWTRRCREVAEFALMGHVGPSDFTMFLIVRRSKNVTFDGLYFGRGIGFRDGEGPERPKLSAGEGRYVRGARRAK